MSSYRRPTVFPTSQEAIKNKALNKRLVRRKVGERRQNQKLRISLNKTMERIAAVTAAYLTKLPRRAPLSPFPLCNNSIVQRF